MHSPSPRRSCHAGIGTRARMAFKDVAPGLAVPLWAIDETAAQPVPWRCPET
jgi:hypothetical protein